MGLMAEANVGKEHLTRVQLWIADYSHFDLVNEVYDAWLQVVRNQYGLA